MQQPVAREGAPATETKFSVRHLFQTLKRYLPVITLTFLAVMVAYVILAVAKYAMAPSQNISSISFRLEFAGASAGVYPNGTRFSPSDIINAPILAKVYNENELKRYMGFGTFKSNVFIVESNFQLEALQREYRVKLNDPKLIPVDRERLEREYETKAQSIPRSDYAIHFMHQEGMSRIPPTIANKVLIDILNTFAEQAVKDRGGLDYRIPLVTRSIFNDVRPQNAENLMIATDILRTKINRALVTIDTLLDIPGTEVLRTEKDQISLPEVRSRFEEILRFQIQPLTARLAASNTDDTTAVRTYLTSQLEYNEFRAAESRRRGEALRNALSAYQRPEVPLQAAGGGTMERPAENPTPRPGGPQGVTPQVTEGFIDRIVSMATQSADVRYRQEAVQRIANESMNLVPYEGEASYYRSILAKVGTGGGSHPLTQEEARQQLTATYNNALAAIDQLVEIHRLLSKNLNPSNVMYSVTLPPSVRRERTVTPTRLGIYGILLAMVTLPVIIAACLIHNRVREEEEEDEAAFESREISQQPT
ncbi:MAG TPA: hypothetical protein VEK11_22100 [Thermoanaerobaculia bacterium]|nr:hypothetical protein [Thermoanaerobaculia bacterium]